MRHLLSIFLAVCLLAAASTAAAQTFDFETPDQLNSPVVSGDKQNFVQTLEQAHNGSTQSLKFTDPAPEPFESWTYDLPFALTSGTIRVWFYDERGAAATGGPGSARWGGAIILEDANNPADFGAVEISELPYGGGRYYGSEGSVDRQFSPDPFDSASFPLREVGFHEVVFTVGATESTISVDGMVSDQVGAPGGDKTLRLRIMCGSPGNGSAPAGTPGLPPGYQPNWMLTAPGTEVSPPTAIPWIYYDDIAIDSVTPAVNSHTMGFEVIAGTPEYDTIGSPFPPLPPNDNPRMKDFVNQWGISTNTTFAHGGLQSARFLNDVEPHRSITFETDEMTAGQQIRLWFYDALGPDTASDKFGGSILLESGTNPANFVGVEIWNFTYPLSMDPTPGGPNYYLVQGFAGAPNFGFLYSRAFGNRTIGWHEVVITVNATSSTITVDGMSDLSVTGPGLNSNPKLRILADSATGGGFSNWIGADELDITYLATREPYVYYDDIVIPTLPVPTSTPSPVPSVTPSPAPTITAMASVTPTVTPEATATPGPCCPGDADNSGSFVDANDFIAVQANFGADNGVGGPGDADCGGSFVDANDFIAVQANFGSDCGVI